MAQSRKNSILKTDKRIRLGIWGLGRGMSFYSTCKALGFDVVAGCDYNEHMRQKFLEQNPGALATDDDEEFLNSDIDAVLLATFCPAHADDAIRCLDAGKHVLSEVTSFHTMAEGVRLIEAIERSGRVYNLAENYPFSKPNLYLAAKWAEGLFGELMYAEYEYVHECRSLCYTYIDGVPVQPGHAVHNWRSWLDFHYYNTHSLGPMMHITKTRPTRVAAFPTAQHLPGYVMKPGAPGMGAVAPSMITMSNGAVVRNLMGCTTNDSHLQRIWGTKGSAEINNGVFLRLGGGGGSPKMEVEPEWPEHGDFADKTGHGGGDFWVLYHFARHILEGTPAFFDAYTAADCTIPGILAVKSTVAGGAPQDVPDFRDKAQREAFRDDHFDHEHYDTVDGAFPKRADKKQTGRFSTIMKDLCHHAQQARATIDWLSVADEAADPKAVADLADRFLKEHGAMKATFAAARRLVKAYPRSDGARVMREMLDLGDADKVGRKAFVDNVRKQRTRLRRRRPSGG